MPDVILFIMISGKLNFSINKFYNFQLLKITSMKNILLLFAALLFISITKAQVNPPSINIGTQTWMVKNLDVDHYRNGDPIPQLKDPAAWANLTTGVWFIIIMTRPMEPCMVNYITGMQ